jgi:adenosylhomocysteine nucleosidase
MRSLSLRLMIFRSLITFALLFVSAAFASAFPFKTIGLVSAWDPEMKALKRAVLSGNTKVRNTEIDGTVFSEVQQNDRRLVFWMSGVSMVNAAMSTQRAIDRFHPDAILFSGIAGGLDPAFQPGDVVIPMKWIHQAEAAWLNPNSDHPGSYVIPEYFHPRYPNFGNIFPDDVWVVRKGETTPRQVHAFAVDGALLDAARITAPKISILRADGTKAKVLVGGTGMSGPIFLDDRSFRDFAFQKWHARIHEMEGTAIAQVGYANRVPILIIRALSDLAGGQRGVNQEEKNSELAAGNAAEVTAKILEQIEYAH